MNSKYNEGRNGLALKLINLDTDTLTLYACDASYLALAWDSGTGTFIGVGHDFTDVIGILDSTALTATTVSADGWLTSAPAVFPALAIAEDTACLVLRDTTTGLLLAFYDYFQGFVPIAMVGDGTSKTINPPLSGWYRA